VRTAAGEVTLEAASLPQRGALDNLMQLYMHDFSELMDPTPGGEFGEDGRFSPYPLDAYWADDDHIALLIRLEGRLAGFALLNRTSHSGLAVDRNVAEFFVARNHRRSGVGFAAARAIFSRYPGVWEAAVIRRNQGAHAFWGRAIRGCPGACDIEEMDLSTASWNGPIFRFSIAGGPQA
jgi:predicted acetyltransferase